MNEIFPDIKKKRKKKTFSTENNRKNKNFVEASTVLDKLINNFGLESEIMNYLIQQKWDLIVGETVSVHTMPYQVRNKRLYLYVDNSSWMHQLFLLKRTIIDSVNRYFVKDIISDIHLKKGKIELKDKKESTPENKRITVLSEDELLLINEILKPIKDDEIKESVRHLMILHYQSDK